MNNVSASSRAAPSSRVPKGVRRRGNNVTEIANQKISSESSKQKIDTCKIKINPDFQQFVNELDRESKGRFTFLLQELAPLTILYDDALIHLIPFNVIKHLKKAQEANTALLEKDPKLKAEFQEVSTIVRNYCNTLWRVTFREGDNTKEALDKAIIALNSVVPAVFELKKSITAKLAGASNFSTNSKKVCEIKTEGLTQVFNGLSFLFTISTRNSDILLLSLRHFLNLSPEFYEQMDDRLPTMYSQIMEQLQEQIACIDKDVWDKGKLQDFQIAFEKLQNFFAPHEKITLEKILVLKTRTEKILTLAIPNYQRAGKFAAEGSAIVEFPNQAFLLLALNSLVLFWEHSLVFKESLLTKEHFECLLCQLDEISNNAQAIKEKVPLKDLEAFLSLNNEKFSNFVYAANHSLDSITRMIESNDFKLLKENLEKFKNNTIKDVKAFSDTIMDLNRIVSNANTFWATLQHEFVAAEAFLADHNEEDTTLSSNVLEQVFYHTMIKMYSPKLILWYFSHLSGPTLMITECLANAVDSKRLRERARPVKGQRAGKNRATLKTPQLSTQRKNQKKRARRAKNKGDELPTKAAPPLTDAPAKGEKLSTEDVEPSPTPKEVDAVLPPLVDVLPPSKETPALEATAKEKSMILEPVESSSDAATKITPGGLTFVEKELPLLKQTTTDSSKELASVLREIQSSKQRKFRNFSKLVKKYGWKLDHVSGDHYIFTHKSYPGSISVPHHDVVALGTARAIIKQLFGV